MGKKKDTITRLTLTEQLQQEAKQERKRQRKEFVQAVKKQRERLVLELQEKIDQASAALVGYNRTDKVSFELIYLTGLDTISNTAQQDPTRLRSTRATGYTEMAAVLSDFDIDGSTIAFIPELRLLATVIEGDEEIEPGRYLFDAYNTEDVVDTILRANLKKAGKQEMPTYEQVEQLYYWLYDLTKAVPKTLYRLNSTSMEPA